MRDLNVMVANRIATFQKRDGCIVCGNSDYKIIFTFDSEWKELTSKTARFIWNGEHTDVAFEGDECAVPIIKNATEVEVGVYAGDLQTTTSAVIPCKRSILCGETPIRPEAVEKYRDEALEAAERAEEAAERAENAGGGGGGGSGENGATFTPDVSEDGVLSWTNDKGLPNPDPVKIEGADGVGIAKIELYNTVAGGTIDIYRITYTDPDRAHTDFEVHHGTDGDPGKDGTSPTVSVSKSGKVTTITITDKNGTKTATINDGANGTNGKDGTNGEDYVLTAADKQEIAEMVDGATVVQAPKYVNSVDEMTDTSRVYVLASTGRVWAYMDTTVEQEVTVRDNIIGSTSNPYQTGRLSSGGALSEDVQTHTITPYIEISKYAGKTIEIHLEGNRYATATTETYIMSALFDATKATLFGRGYTMQASGGILGQMSNGSLVINGETSATMTITIPCIEKSTGKEIAYIRFCGLGNVTDSVYITYRDMQTVTGGAWVDTGTSYSPSISNEDMNIIAEQAAAIVDNNLLSVIGSGEVSV